MSRSTPPSAPRAHQPRVPATTSLPELTPKAILLGVILAMALAGANAYLGLFAGLTVSASIPAAVISLAILRMFRHHNVLENNLVQTMASAGEAVAAGVIFTIPALVLLGAWTRFDYWQVTVIAGLGGFIGVLFTIPLRHALIVERDLQFPEGVATAEVLDTGDRGGAGVRYIALAAITGAAFKFAESGLGLWNAAVQGTWSLGKWLLYMGSNVSPALLAVGYIVGLNIAVLVFGGGAISWMIGIPIWLLVHGEEALPQGVGGSAAAGWIWSNYIRYMGIGAMVVGGIWALISLRGALATGIRSGLRTYRTAAEGAAAPEILRTERDTPMTWVIGLLVVAIIPIFVIYQNIVGAVGISLLMAVLMIVAGFLFCAVAAYMAGLVGSSNNPVSGVTIATILSASLLLVLLMGRDSQIGASAAILIGAVVCVASAIGGDNMQDLKAGYILGSTPWKQQIAQMIGTLASALVMAPVLTLLLTGYGMGPPTEAQPNSLAAPQASLMASVARGVFSGGLPWAMAAIGAVIAAAVIAFDERQRVRGADFRTPVLAVAVGIYLPLQLTTPILLGGIIAHLAGKARGGRVHRNGLLFASGLITGEALVGILLAIPLVVFSRNIFAVPLPGGPQAWPGMLLLAGIMIWLYRTAANAADDA